MYALKKRTFASLQALAVEPNMRFARWCLGAEYNLILYPGSLDE
jgi:hypothetical protein